MSKKHIGSSIDDFLKGEGIFEEAQSQAIKEVVAWEESRNKHVPVDWHFTTADARVGLYPTI